MANPCQVNSAGQIKHKPCGWTTDVERAGNIVRCRQCGSRFAWRDGHFFAESSSLTPLRVAGKALGVAGKIALAIPILVFCVFAISQDDDCDCDGC